jgi:hypothetical protein
MRVVQVEDNPEIITVFICNPATIERWMRKSFGKQTPSSWKVYWRGLNSIFFKIFDDRLKSVFLLKYL